MPLRHHTWPVPVRPSVWAAPVAEPPPRHDRPAGSPERRATDARPDVRAAASPHAASSVTAEPGRRPPAPRRAPSLLACAAAPVTLRAAWVRIRARGKGTPGVDGVTVEAYDARLDAHIERLARCLLDGSYRPLPLRRLVVGTGDKARTLAIPTVEDRLVQTSLLLTLQPGIERLLSDSAYAYRPGRGVAQASRHLERHLRDRRPFVAKGDIAAFFDEIPRQPLFDALAELVPDPDVRALVRTCLDAPLAGHIPAHGLPQGGVLSPMLSNVYLLPFDRAFAREALPLLRYADDFAVPCHTADEAARALALARSELGALGLRLHPEKSRVVALADGFTFLGVAFGPDRGPLAAAMPAATLPPAPARSAPVPARAPAPARPPAAVPVVAYTLTTHVPRRVLAFRIRPEEAPALRPGTPPHAPTPDDVSAHRPDVDDDTLFTAADDFSDLADDRLDDGFADETLDGLDDEERLPDDLHNDEDEEGDRPADARPTVLPTAPRPTPGPPSSAAARMPRALYLHTHGSTLGLHGDRLQVYLPGSATPAVRLGIARVAEIVVVGHVTLSPAALRRCLADGVPVTLLSSSGRFVGRLEADPHRAAAIVRAQCALAADPAACLALARRFVAAKVRNSRALLARARRRADGPDLREASRRLARIARRLDTAPSVDGLRGLEGAAAAAYFAAFGRLVDHPDFAFTTRSRRPPADAVNALLSFLYTLAHGALHGHLVRARLHPYVGFFHADAPGHPALASDLLEEFRPRLDALALALLHRGELTPAMFEPHGDGVYLAASGRTAVLRAWQAFLRRKVAHDGQARTYWNVMHEQAQRLARLVRGEDTDYRPFGWR